MALAASTLATVVSGAASTLASGSYTPTASEMQAAGISATGSINGQTVSSISVTHSGTGAFTRVAWTPIASSKCHAGIAYARTGASPGSGTLTVNFAAAATDNELIVAEVTGSDPTTPVDVSASTNDGDKTTATTPVLTLGAAPLTADLTLALFAGRNVGAAPSVPSGTGTFTSLGSNNHANPCASIGFSYRLSSTSTTITPAGLGTIANAGAAVVFKAPSGPTPITLSEAGTGTDAVTVAPAVPLAETGTGIDAVVVAPAIPLTEAPHGADALTANATVALTETSTGVDAIAITATVALTETGSSVETIAVGIPQVLPGETGTGVDAITVAPAVPLSDARPAATDALTLTATVPLSDARPVTDALALTATVPLADARPAATDAIVVAPTVPLTDTSTGADALAASATVSLTEVSSGVDSISIDTGSTLVALSDSSSSVETINVVSTQDSYQFVSPLFTRDRAGSDRFWGQLTVTHSISILKHGTAYVPVQGPTNEQIVAADATYLGGHIYTVTAAEAAALTAAGYGAGLS